MNSNKILGYLAIIILIIYTALGISIKTTEQNSIIIGKLFDGLYVVLLLLGIAFILLTTKVLENHKRTLVKIGDGLVIVGTGIKILHLPFIVSFVLISAGLIIILIDQLLRLKTKKDDLSVERLKIIWYLFFWTGVVFKIFHLPGAQILVFISVIVLWSAISAYLFKNGIPKYISQ